MPDVEPPSTNQPAINPVGRPLKFQSVDDLDTAIEQYFAEQSPHVAKRKIRIQRDDGTFAWGFEEYMTEQLPLTVSGLARALGISRDTLISYKDDREEFVDSVERAYQRCHEYAETQLYGKAQSGAAFSLKNNWGWRDRQEIDHTTKDQPIPLLAGLAPAKLVVEDDDAAAPADDSSDQDQSA